MVLIAGCSHASVKKNVIQKVEQIDTLEQLSQIWKSDSNGCSHVRSWELFKELFDGYKLKMSSSETFKGIYGDPNEETVYKGSEDSDLVLIYYIESICPGDTLVGNRTWISVNFDTDYKFVEIYTGINKF